MGPIVSQVRDVALVDGDEVLRTADRREGDGRAVEARVTSTRPVGADPGELPPAGRISGVGRKRAVADVIRLELDGDVEPEAVEGTIAVVATAVSGVDGENAIVDVGSLDGG